MIIEQGDRVIDPLDGSIREISEIQGTTAFMIDGGVMGIDEIDRVYLPGEEIV